jgi:hypothetical protein
MALRIFARKLSPGNRLSLSRQIGIPAPLSMRCSASTSAESSRTYEMKTCPVEREACATDRRRRMRWQTCRSPLPVARDRRVGCRCTRSSLGVRRHLNVSDEASSGCQ